MHKALPHMCIHIGGRSVKTGNLAARDMVSKPFGTKRRKFIDLRHHILQKYIETGHMDFMHVARAEQKAYIMTKPLRRFMFIEQCNAIGTQTHKRMRDGCSRPRFRMGTWHVGEIGYNSAR